jgi:hypothetical protein
LLPQTAQPEQRTRTEALGGAALSYQQAPRASQRIDKPYLRRETQFSFWGEVNMSWFRACWIAIFKSFTGARSVKGGSGHYNEQCHPQTYG